MSKLSKINNSAPFSDGTRLKEHIITPTHIENSKITQEIESKRMRTTFLTSFFNDNYNTPTMNTGIIDLTGDQPTKILLTNQIKYP